MMPSRPRLYRATVSALLGALALTIAACNPNTNGPVTAPAGRLPGVPTGNATPLPGPRLPESLLLGNPDNATGDTENHNHLLVLRKQFALSYNDTNRFPNWVGWHLQQQDIGNTERADFRPDSQLPEGFLKVTPADYTNSGYDRGHNCPSKDRSATREDNDAVFVMSNITPQQHGMNAGPWEQLESYCRTLASQGNELYIYCGHGFDGPKGKTIGKAKVAIPDFGWKVIVVLPAAEGDDLVRVGESTRVIAVRMPNISTISKEDWKQYKVSVAEIEKATGLKFFTTLAPAVAEKLKGKVDAAATEPARDGKPTEEISGVNVKNSVTVWVNLSSGVYWKPGTKYFGKTKEGKYMSELEALRAGYHKAEGQ